MKNFIFDLYGTLVDISTDETDSRFRSAIEGVFSEFGVKLTEKKIFDLYYDGINKRIKEKYSEPDLKAVFCDIFLAGGVTPGESTIRSAASSFRQLSTKRMKLFPFALDTLNSLKQKSARIYLLSNAQALFTRPELRLLNLEQLFDDVLLSSEFADRTNPTSTNTQMSTNTKPASSPTCTGLTVAVAGNARSAALLERLPPDFRADEVYRVESRRCFSYSLVSPGA